MTNNIYSNLIIFVVGILLLIWSADRFVLGASTIAKRMKISNLLIGLTIVAVGTSLPELFISILATINHTPKLSIGDAIGSNMANIGLISSCMIILKPSVFSKSVSLRMVILFVFITFLSICTFANGYLSPLDSLFLLSLFTIFILSTIFLLKNNHQILGKDSLIPKNILSIKTSVDWLLFGIIALPISAQITVTGALGVAEYLGVNEFIIGLFLVAIGTSLPELATTFVSILKNEKEIALGNIIGSNIFNITLVLVPICIITPTQLPSEFLTWDLPFFLGITVFFVLMISVKHKRLLRTKGFVLFIYYLLYLVMSMIRTVS